jgi:TolA-binding protein
MTGRKSRIAQLASIGEDVLDLAAKSPAANRVRRGAVQLKDRVDDLQKQVRGLQGLEEQIAKLERRVDKLERSAKRARSASPAARKPRAPKAPPPTSPG